MKTMIVLLALTMVACGKKGDEIVSPVVSPTTSLMGVYDSDTPMNYCTKANGLWTCNQTKPQACIDYQSNIAAGSPNLVGSGLFLHSLNVVEISQWADLSVVWNGDTGTINTSSVNPNLTNFTFEFLSSSTLEVTYVPGCSVRQFRYPNNKQPDGYR